MIYPWQKIQWQKIDQLITADRLPHALYLQGNQGLGKSDFAIALAHAVLCRQPQADHQACGRCPSCQLLAAGTHPDLHYLQPVPAKKTKSTKPALRIRIDIIRDLCDKLNQTSQYNGYRVAIIDQADQLTIEAANSLLKTLEEPGRQVLIILVSARAHRLPVTIRSRCQMIRFSVPEKDLSAQWLAASISSSELDKKPDEKQMQQLLKQAFGSPLAAFNLIKQAEQQQLLADAMTAAVSGRNSLEYAAKLAKFAKLNLLEQMLCWVSDLNKLMSCGDQATIINEQSRSKLLLMAKTANQKRLFQFYDQLNLNILHSSIAVNEQLMWENLLLSWENL